MTIENPSFVVFNHKLRYLLIIGAIVSITFILLLDVFEEPIHGISRNGFVFIALLLYVIITFSRYILDYHYVNFSLDQKKLSIKYYSLRPFAGKRKNIEIPLQSLLKYEIENTVLGFKPQISIFQRIQGKVAKYPPIPLSGYKKEQIAQIKHILNTLLQAGK